LLIHAGTDRDGRRERMADMRIKKLLFRVFFLVAAAGLLVAPAVRAQGPFENLDRLDSLVAMTVGANIGEPGGPVAPVDRRLRLKACPATPKVEGPVFSAAIVSCAATGWRLRVPLAPALEVQPQPTTRNPAFNRPGAKTASEPVVDLVIKKGDPVELIAGNDIFSVSRLMIADEDGAVGQLISVREDRKSAPVSARVERAGVVRTPSI
jgi:flagellar basal body P-ring formation protein FlgA